MVFAFAGSATGQPAPSQAPYASPSPSRAQQGYYGDSPPALHAMHYPPAHAPNGAASAFAAAQPNGGAPSAASEDGGSPHMADPPHPASYMEVRLGCFRSVDHSFLTVGPTEAQSVQCKCKQGSAALVPAVHQETAT